jgi:hypothetical protein
MEEWKCKRAEKKGRVEGEWLGKSLFGMLMDEDKVRYQNEDSNMRIVRMGICTNHWINRMLKYLTILCSDDQ